MALRIVPESWLTSNVTRSAPDLFAQPYSTWVSWRVKLTVAQQTDPTLQLPPGPHAKSLKHTFPGLHRQCLCVTIIAASQLASNAVVRFMVRTKCRVAGRGFVGLCA